MSKDAAKYAEREARMAEALRANLKRRKAQQRGTSDAALPAGDSSDESLRP